MKKVTRSLPVRVVSGLVHQYFEDGVARSAAELAYYLLFSIFPMLIVVNAVVSRLELNAEALLLRLGIMLPAEIVEIFSGYLAHISRQNAQVMLFSGLFITVYMMARAMRSLMRSVMRAYRMERGGVIFFALSFGLSLLVLVSIFVLLVALVLAGALLEKIGQYVSLSPQFFTVLGWLRYVIAPAFLFWVLAVFYDVVGGRRYSLRMAMPGAAFFVVGWTLATLGFSFYVANMSNYSLLYGSIGAIMILMLWLYMTAVLLILGGVFNRVLAQERGPARHEE